MARDRANKRQAVSFTRSSAEEIAAVVRAFRGGDRDQAPVMLPRAIRGGDAAYTWGLALNNTSRVVPRFGVLELTPGTDLLNIEATGGGAAHPTFTGNMPWVGSVHELAASSGRNYFYGVALEDIPAGQTGRVAVSGVVPARVYVNSESDRLCGPCVTPQDPTNQDEGFASTRQFESGWGNVEIVGGLSAVGSSIVTSVRLGGRPFRCHALNDTAVSRGINGTVAIVRVGGYSGSTTVIDGVTYGERNLMHRGSTGVTVRFSPVYSSLRSGARIVVEQSAWGTFVPILWES
jgi:hypothetical protein